MIIKKFAAATAIATLAGAAVVAVPAASSANETTTYTYQGPPVAVPDGDATGVEVPITVPDGVGNVTGLTVKLNDLATTYAGDLDISLVSPSATSRELTDNYGGEGVNFIDTVFDDAAATSISTVASSEAPFTGSYRPVQTLATTAGTDFLGQPAPGVWKLKVADPAPGDVATVNMWSLTITTGGGEKAMQSPMNSCVKALRNGAVVEANTVTKLTKKNCRTNAGKAVKVRGKSLLTRGDMAGAFRVYKQKGVWKLKTYGSKANVRVIWSAPGNADYTAYKQTRAYKIR